MPKAPSDGADELDSLPFPTLRCDMHTHILPHRLATRIRTFFEVSGMIRCCPPPTSSATDETGPMPELAYPIEAVPLIAQLFAELSSPPSSATRRGRSVSETRRALLNAGNTPYDGSKPLHLVTLPYAHKGDMSHRLNEDLFHLSRSLTRDELWNDRLLITPGFTCHPSDSSPPAVEVVKHALGRGGKVMKLHCSVGEMSVLDERLEGVWRMAEETGFVTVVHCGRNVMGTTEADELDELKKFVERYPNAKIVIAHFGHPATEQALALSKHPSIYYDLTPVVVAPISLPAPSPPSTCSSLILSLASQGRILFGSDVPNVAIPVSSSIRRIQRWLHEAARAEGGERWRARAADATKEVLGKAAETLLDAVDGRKYWRSPDEETPLELTGVQAPRSLL